MVFEETTLTSMEEIFNKALEVAKSGDGDRCQTFLTTYANWISEVNGCYKDSAINIAKNNLGYFAGYYNRDVYNAINMAYGAVHPIFGKNPFDVSPEEAYELGLSRNKK